jgi:hypothetical protein
MLTSAACLLIFGIVLLAHVEENEKLSSAEAVCYYNTQCGTPLMAVHEFSRNRLFAEASTRFRYTCLDWAMSAQGTKFDTYILINLSLFGFYAY